MAKPSKDRLIFGLFLIVLVAIGEVVLHLLHLPSWPAFICMIFFFMAHMDKKVIPNIMVGGTFGVLSMYIAIGLITVVVKYLLIPVFGMGRENAIFGGILIFIIIFVYAIIVVGEVFPMVFNNYAFTAMLFAATYDKITEPVKAIPVWQVAIVLVIGGGAMIGGILGILAIMKVMIMRRMAKAAQKQ